MTFKKEEIKTCPYIRLQISNEKKKKVEKINK